MAAFRFSLMTHAAVESYRKHFSDWDSFAAVRIKPNTYRLDSEGLQKELHNKRWFIPQGIPLLSHPLLKNLSNEEVQYLMGRFLLQFLEYGVLMEHEYVNTITAEIALGECNFNIPEIMRLDGMRIYTDEGYHACFTLEAAQYVREYIGLPATAWPLKNSRLEGMRKLISDAPDNDQFLVRFGIVSISETVAAKELSESMRNIVVDPITNLFIDHAQDESKHCLYFSALLTVIWEQLSLEEKIKLGCYFPKILKAFVNINVYPLYEALNEIGVRGESAETIVTESYPVTFSVKRALGVATKSFDLFKRLQIFKHQDIRKSFIEEGFPEEALT